MELLYFAIYFLKIWEVINILEVKNLSYSYKKNVKVLDNINFSVSDGEHLSVIGINGCGKSTLLKCLCNFLSYQGSIRINGRELKEFKYKELAKEVSILFQQTNIYFDYKVIDVIKFGRYSYLKFRFFEDDNHEVDLDSLLKNMGIHHLKYNYMSELSGGEKQKVFITRLLYQNPRIVLLDEFNNSLDLSSQIYIMDNFKKLFEGKIVISVFHDLNLVRSFSNKVMALKNGNIYRFGDSENIFKKEVLYDIYGVDVEKFMIDSFERWKNGKCY